MTRALTALALTASLAAGCSSLEPQYGCPAPNGIACMSITEVSDRDTQGLPMRRRVPEDPTDDADTRESGAPGGTPLARPTLVSRAQALALPTPRDPGDPIFREPLRLRVWVVDWQDRDRVYHPNHYLYVQVDPGEWVLPRMRERLDPGLAPW